MNNIAYENPIVKHFFDLDGKYTLSLLDRLIGLALKYNNVYVAQKMLAKMVGCERETVNRLTSALHRMDLIKKINRGVKRTCLYRLSEIFIDKAQQLRHLFPSLKYLWNMREIFKWVPTLKTVVESNFLKLSHNNKYNIYIQEFEPSTGIVSSQIEMLNRQYPSQSQQMTPEIDHIFSGIDHDRSSTIHKNIYIKNKEQSVEELAVSPMLQKVSDTLNLTKWGLIKLSPFPDSALEYTLAQLKFCKINNRFKWFLEACILWCKANDIRIEWRTFYDLRDQHQMPSTPVYVKSGKTVANTSQSTTEWSPVTTSLPWENERSEEEEKAYIIEQYNHFEAHRHAPKDADKETARKYLHPSAINMTNPFLSQYNALMGIKNEELETVDIFSSILSSVKPTKIDNSQPNMVEQQEVPFMSDDSDWDEL